MEPDSASSSDLSLMTVDAIQDYLERRSAVLIPLGSHEQHGRHLPLGTDAITALAVASGVSALTGVPHTPVVWMGYSPQHMYEPESGRGTITVRSSTYTALIYDIGRSLIHQGFDKLIFINGHGGNGQVIDPALRALRYDSGALIVFVHAIHQAHPVGGLFEDILEAEPHQNPGGHGAELETSLYLAWDPGHVVMDKASDASYHNPAHLPPAFFGSRGRPALSFEDMTYFRSPIDFTDFTDEGIVGSPATAEPGKGSQALERLVEHVARGVEQLDNIEVAVHTREFRDRAL